MKKLILIRRCSQVFFLSLFIYILWSTTYPLKGLISPQVLFKIDPLIMILTSISERVVLTGIAFSVWMLILSLLLGRFFCGWVCPLGTMIDGAGLLKRKKTIVSDEKNRKLRKIKFIILGVAGLFSLVGIQIAWIFDPLVIVARVASLNIIPTVTLGIDRLFVGLIQNFELYGSVYDFYRQLKTSFLGIEIHYFANSLVSLIYFLMIVLAAFFLSRAWCRLICPLGAMYSVIGRVALLERRVGECSECGICRDHCRMGAIKEDLSYVKGECILCMDCIYNCPLGKIQFSWRKNPKKSTQQNNANGISRKDFLFLLFSSIFFLGFKKSSKKRLSVIRPPGSLKEDRFLDRCVRCGNCMKVCITNGLQPTIGETGIQGIWTPQLIPEIGYCEYNCTLCGQVCPTGAIVRLPVHQKQKVRLGIAEINRSLCTPWAQNEECIVCEEHCLVSDKAIKTEVAIIKGKKILRPVVDENLCIGCGICQNKCPVDPVRAIRVNPETSDRL